MWVTVNRGLASLLPSISFRPKCASTTATHQLRLQTMSIAVFVLIVSSLHTLSLAHPGYWLEKATGCTSHPDRAYGQHQDPKKDV